MKFSILPSGTRVELTSQERELVKAFIGTIPQIEWNAETIHNTIHDLVRRSGIDPKSGFGAFYRILTGKDRGPRLGYFLANLDRNWVLDRFKTAIST